VVSGFSVNNAGRGLAHEEGPCSETGTLGVTGEETAPLPAQAANARKTSMRLTRRTLEDMGGIAPFKEISSATRFLILKDDAER
jgi:hypothetical protein